MHAQHWLSVTLTKEQSQSPDTVSIFPKYSLHKRIGAVLRRTTSLEQEDTI